MKVNVHDFPDKELGKAIPYGVYDIGATTGWVNVGTDHDNAAFAVNALRTWWNSQGRAAYPQAATLTITADSGGSNGNRLRAWKVELAALAAETGLSITVLHLPPGTSKWNRIEHRLFSAITMNWRRTPLTSHEAVVSLIGATTTGTGLAETPHHPGRRRTLVALPEQLEVRSVRAYCTVGGRLGCTVRVISPPASSSRKVSASILSLTPPALSGRNPLTLLVAADPRSSAVRAGPRGTQGDTRTQIEAARLLFGVHPIR